MRTSPSIVQRRASDVRLFGVAGYALTLQVAHPTIAAGVRDHSDFARDPWGRFFRTTDYLALLIYGSPETSRAVSRRLRGMHATIRGTAPDGKRYAALEPSAYAWVHGTLAEAIVRGHDVFGTPLTRTQREEFWAEWRALGAVLGVGDTDLPETWPGFQEYLSRMTEEVLEGNDVMRAVLRTSDRAVGGSPWAWLDDRLWAVAGVPLAHYGRFLSIGTMPPALRRRLGLPWSAVEDAAFSLVAAAHRATTPALPRHLRCAGPMVLRVRQREIDRGPFGDRHHQRLASSQ